MSTSRLENTVSELCRFIEQNCESTLTLAQLASRAALSPFHLQRSFQAIVGLSPRQFQQACRLRRLKSSLSRNAPATAAIFDAGYGSLSRVYETASAYLGMTPDRYRRGGQGLIISSAALETPFGLMLLGATDRGLCFLQFGPDEASLQAALRAEYPAATLQPLAEPYPEQLELWARALRAHLAGHPNLPDLPLDLRATAFQAKVWRYLQTIPRGATRSYSEVAAAIGQPAAARAVAGACAANPVAIVIPCHRVIRGTGEPGGYRWGLERKRALLEAEHSSPATA